MERGLLLDVVVAESTAILKLLARKDEPLLVRRDALFVLDLCFDIVNCVTRFNVQRDRLPCQSLDEDLHCSKVKFLFVLCLFY